MISNRIKMFTTNLKAKNVIKILEEVEKKHESQAAAKYIHCEYPLAEKNICECHILYVYQVFSGI